MTITIFYFASIKEALDCEKEEYQADVETVGNLIEQLSQRGDIWRKTLGQESLLIAVNQTVSDKDTKIKDGDEVAFFPPVTGG